MAFSAASSAGTLLTRLLGKSPVIAAAPSVVPEASTEALAFTTAPAAPSPTLDANGWPYYGSLAIIPSRSEPAAASGTTAAASCLAAAPWHHCQTSSAGPVLAHLCSCPLAFEKQRQAAECSRYAWQLQPLFARTISSTGPRQCEQNQQQQQQGVKISAKQKQKQQQQPHQTKNRREQQDQQQHDHKQQRRKLNQRQQHGKRGLRQQQQQGEITKSFHDTLTRVKQYFDAHGHLPPLTYKEPPTGLNPRQWLINLRSKYERGSLPSDLIAALDEALGDVWRVRHRRAFSDLLGRLKDFQKSNGRLPRRPDVDGDGLKIGVWAKDKRAAYHAGRLPADRIAALEGVPGWTWRVIPTADEWLDAAREFEQTNGRRPRGIETWDGLHVAQWIHDQRKMYHRGKLSEEQIAACESLPGWVWKLRTKRCNKLPFETGLAALEQFVQSHGRLPKKTEVGDAPDVVHLGTWCSALRVRKKRGELSPDQIAAVEEVPGWWWENGPRPYRLW